MKRRVQRRQNTSSLYKFEDRSQRTSPRSLLQSLTDLFGVIAAGATLFAALLYLAGRSFANGYFEAMNIPSYQVSFSLWEYGEVGWLPLLLYPVSMLILSGYLSGILGAIREWIFGYFIGNALKRLRDRLFNWLKKTKWIQDFLTWLKSRVKSKMPTIQLPNLSRETLFYFKAANFGCNLLIFLGLILITLYIVRVYGTVNGKIGVLDKAVQVELISLLPMALDENQVAPMQNNSQGYYVYKGFHLLTSNNGNYYLFKEIDPDTCKPLKVYIVEQQENLQVSYLPAVSLRNQCNP